MNIPLSDLANSTCNSTHCEGVIDAATQAVTGNQAVIEKIEQALNASSVLKNKAQPKPSIPVVPPKRKAYTSKINKKSTGPAASA